LQNAIGRAWRETRIPAVSRTDTQLPSRPEASTLAYADAFRVIMILLVIATLLVPLMRKVVPTGAASSQAH
jgi:hypothetical protein